MSLLIKALDKAEKAQADKAKKTQSKRAPKALKTDFGSTGQFQAMSLAEPNSDLLSGSADPSVSPGLASPHVQGHNAAQASVTNPTPVASAVTIPTVHPERAANVFAAKRIEPSSQNAKLAIIGSLALLALLGMAWYVYQAIKIPEPAILPRPGLPMAQVQSETVSAAVSQVDSVDTGVSTQTQSISKIDKDQSEKPMVEDTSLTKPYKASAKKADSDSEVFDTKDTVPLAEKTAEKKIVKTNNEIATLAVASRSVSVSVSKKKSEQVVNPTLMRAYEAYNAGNDSEAQKLYKQVLQQDIRNIDALLGLGAIAVRQGRDADANGWYSKVLEIEPRNAIAQAAMVDNQDADQSSESRLKAMIEKSPNDADLHARLGHLYADANQWAAAQQAYFEANRLNPTAENAFNLAVSLDQMGKPKLALPYYQKALETINNNSGIDKSALEARIQAIQ